GAADACERLAGAVVDGPEQAFGEELLVPEYRGDGRAQLVCNDAEESDIRIRAGLAFRRMPVLRGGIVQAACIRASMCHDHSSDASLPPEVSRGTPWARRSEEHTSELQSRENLVCRLLLEKKKKKIE